MIGDEIYIFVKKMLQTMKRPEFQLAPYELKVRVAQTLFELGACTNIRPWRKEGSTQMMEKDWLENQLEQLVGPQPEAGTTAGAGLLPVKSYAYPLLAPADLRSIADEAMESLYKEGEFVKVLDELGKPKLNETGNQIYRTIDHATDAELAFYKKEMAPPMKPPDPPELAKLRLTAAKLWPSLRNHGADDNESSRGKK